MTSSRKKIVDHTMLSGSVLKIAGRVTKTSEGPAVGSMPTLKTAGKITSPANTATSVSMKATCRAVCVMLVSFLK